ncbi:hypothetical protein BN1708_008871 [Verticillium longisporum]|uniref:Uncharacterized protein n=1 Tax=Verticillium longisporum TaxID=100787 RepID=A0A0G4N8L6_VERLO|nr:hypothetical protein HYQ44_007409 [Verticillium longisporum]CRK42782.1 hypothetical protein BN1708_008871 [Verticillium longisporum]
MDHVLIPSKSSRLRQALSRRFKSKSPVSSRNQSGVAEASAGGMETESWPRTTRDRYELQRANFEPRSARRRGSKSGQTSGQTTPSNRSSMTTAPRIRSESPELKLRTSSEGTGPNTHDVGKGRIDTTGVNIEPEKLDRVKTHPDVYFDHTVITRQPVTHEEIRPHVHTIYEQRRTRSIHYHEHRTLIQPIIDPDPIVLPEQHWAQDHRTGEIFKIPDALGRQLDEQYGRSSPQHAEVDDGELIKAMGKMGLETSHADPEKIKPDWAGFEEKATNE